jgi:hypothetical protein
MREPKWERAFVRMTAAGSTMNLTQWTRTKLGIDMCQVEGIDMCQVENKLGTTRIPGIDATRVCATVYRMTS